MNANPKPFIVPIFIPHSGCPHRCVFCNQAAVTGSRTPLPSPDAVRAEIFSFLRFRRDPHRRTEISFYGGNFPGLDLDIMKDLLCVAEEFVKDGLADGIRFSTRPDTITPDRLEQIAAFPVSTIELGAQSMDDAVLDRSERGHTAGDNRRAVDLLKQFGCAIGLQMMVGLPGDNDASTLATGRAIADLMPDFVRIYPTLVIRGSLLARWYRDGRYTPMTLDGCIDRVKRLYLLFTGKGIGVIRMGLQANEGLDTGTDLIAGPYHPALGEMVLSEILFDAAVAKLAAKSSSIGTVHLRVHPRRVSTMRGRKNINMERLHERFSHIRQFKVVPDTIVEDMAVAVSIIS